VLTNAVKQRCYSSPELLKSIKKYSDFYQKLSLDIVKVTVVWDVTPCVLADHSVDNRMVCER
jgi:hypothetical protein